MTTLLKPPDDWASPSYDEFTRDAESTRHLPGKHDQKSHGRGGVTVGLASGDKIHPAALASAYGVALQERFGERRYLDDNGDLVRSGSGARGDAKSLVAERLAERMAEDVSVDALVQERVEAAQVGHHDDSYEVRRRAEQILTLPDGPPTHMVSVEEGTWKIRVEDTPWMADMDAATLAANIEALAKAGVYPPGSPEAVRMYREESTSYLVKQWSLSSNDGEPRSLAIQRAVEDEFGMARGTTGWDSGDYVAAATDSLYAGSEGVYRAFVRAQYDETQARLSEWGIDSIEVVRGVGGSGGAEATAERLGALGPGRPRKVPLIVDDDGTESTFDTRVWDNVELRTRPASSFSTSPGVAADFTGTDASLGVAVRATVPAESILATPLTGVGALHEGEIVVLGGSGIRGTVMAIEGATGPGEITVYDKVELIEAMRSVGAAETGVLVLDVDTEEADWLAAVAAARPDMAPDIEWYDENESTRHLPGKHDQKSHGRGGGVGTVDDGMPDGWSEPRLDTFAAKIRTKKGAVDVAVPLDAFDYVGLGADGAGRQTGPMEQLEYAKRTATAIARSVDPLIDAYPEFRSNDHSVFILVYKHDDPRSDIGLGDSAAGTHRATADRRQSIINLRVGLFAPPAGEFERWSSVGGEGVMAKHGVGQLATDMRDSAGPHGRNGFHGEATFKDPTRSTIVHEMGHAFDTIRSGGVWDNGTAKRHDPDFPSDQSQWSASRKAGYAQLRSDPSGDITGSVSEYGQKNPAEMYAEGFTEWHMRDVAEPSASARFLAEHEGWEGA